MTRILMTADAVGGVWTYACELARALAPFGYSTTIATMGPLPSADQLAVARAIPDVEIITSEYQLEWMDDPWRDVETAGRWLLDLEARVRPALVHLNGFAHGALPFRSPVLVVGHSCVLSWRDATGGEIEPARLEKYRAAVTAGLRAADRVVAPTAAMLEALQRRYGPLMHASVVPNGRDAEQFVPAEKEPFVFCAGRLWDRAKNVDAVVSAAPRLAWPVVVAGPGGEPREGVTCLGRISEWSMAEWLGRASIVAHPARYEPFGLLPLEAGLAGCALVLGDIASLREVWGDAAMFVKPDDQTALTRAIESLIASAALREAFAARARERASTLTTAAMASGYLTVYERITGPRVRGAHAGRDSAAEGLRCAS